MTLPGHLLFCYCCAEIYQWLIEELTGKSTEEMLHSSTASLSRHLNIASVFSFFLMLWLTLKECIYLLSTGLLVCKMQHINTQLKWPNKVFSFDDCLLVNYCLYGFCCNNGYFLPMFSVFVDNATKSYFQALYV